MATAVIMPRQGQSVESCIIGIWHKKKGDKVSPGDILFSYETDKATFEEEAKVGGVLLEVFYEEGDDVECLQTVCVIGEEGESVEEFRPVIKNAAASDKAEATAGFAGSDDPKARMLNLENEPGVEVAYAQSDEINISPRARKLAEKTGADISRAVPTGVNDRIMERDIYKVIEDGYYSTLAVKGSSFSIAGTGIGGRITTRDIEGQGTAAARSLSHEEAAQDIEVIKLSGVRKIVARAMHTSLSDSAQLTLHSSFDATDVFSFRKELKAAQGYDDSAKITITDIIVFAASRVLLNHKNINAHFLGDKIALYDNAHIGIAVDTPRGLLVPTIFKANSLSLTEISSKAKSLFEKCRQGAIEPDLLKGASFTISNLGGLGIEMFTPILNPPQTGLLGICSVIERTRGGEAYPAMGLSLTFDHRALDGADAARFLKDMVQYLEKFHDFYGG